MKRIPRLPMHLEKLKRVHDIHGQRPFDFLGNAGFLFSLFKNHDPCVIFIALLRHIADFAVAHEIEKVG